MWTQNLPQSALAAQLHLKEYRLGFFEAVYTWELFPFQNVTSKFGEVAASFEEVQSGIQNAARRGYIDRVVNPEDARKYLIAGFEMLFTKNVDFYKKHGTK